MSLTFHQALVQAEALARSTLDTALHERLSCAVALVKDGAVFQDDGGLWTVASASTDSKRYSPNGTCSCQDHHFNKPRYCKHQLAMFLSQRVLTLMHQRPAPVVPEEMEVWPDNDPEDVAPVPAPATTRPRRQIPAKYIQKLQGKDFVRFAGLLQMAQAEGLVELSAVWTANTAELSLAQAVAIFEDGRRYEESGDSSPQNAKNIGLHWRRMSLTRAKARALRDALGVEECAVEELD
jgi:hypothetical protein